MRAADPHRATFVEGLSSKVDREALPSDFRMANRYERPLSYPSYRLWARRSELWSHRADSRAACGWGEPPRSQRLIRRFREAALRRESSSGNFPKPSYAVKCRRADFPKPFHARKPRRAVSRSHLTPWNAVGRLPRAVLRPENAVRRPTWAPAERPTLANPPAFAGTGSEPRSGVSTCSHPRLAAGGQGAWRVAIC